MAEHSEAPKNPQNPTEKSDSEYQPLWDMEQPAPDYSALLLHGTPVPAPTGEIPEPVKEVLEIQKARSASVPADPAVPAAPDSAVPNPAVPNPGASALSVSAPAPSAQAANFFPSAEGCPVLNRPLYGRPGPTMRRMSPMGTDAAAASANQQTPSAFHTWLGENTVGAPRSIGYIPAAPVAGKVRGSELWRKAWPELIALFFIGVVFNPLTYIFLASITGVSGAGGYVLYVFVMLTTVTLGLPLLLWVGALTYTLVRIYRKHQDLKQAAMPLGSFWFYLVYDRLPKDAEEMQGILGAASSMVFRGAGPSAAERPGPWLCLEHGRRIMTGGAQAQSLQWRMDSFTVDAALPVATEPVYGIPDPNLQPMQLLSVLSSDAGPTQVASVRWWNKTGAAVAPWDAPGEETETARIIGYIPASTPEATVDWAKARRGYIPWLIFMVIMQVINPFLLLPLVNIVSMDAALRLLVLYLALAMQTTLLAPLIWLILMVYSLVKFLQKRQDAVARATTYGAFWYHPVYDRALQEADHPDAVGEPEGLSVSAE